MATLPLYSFRTANIIGEDKAKVKPSLGSFWLRLNDLRVTKGVDSRYFDTECFGSEVNRSAGILPAFFLRSPATRAHQQRNSASQRTLIYAKMGRSVSASPLFL
jgi:hypothetical protein